MIEGQIPLKWLILNSCLQTIAYVPRANIQYGINKLEPGKVDQQLHGKCLIHASMIIYSK